MSDLAEWEWRLEDPSAHPNLESKDIHGVYALDKLWAIVAFIEEDDGPAWVHYTGPDPEDAWNGYEAIESFSTLEAAKSNVDESRAETLTYLREIAEDE